MGLRYRYITLEIFKSLVSLKWKELAIQSLVPRHVKRCLCQVIENQTLILGGYIGSQKNNGIMIYSMSKNNFQVINLFSS